MAIISIEQAVTKLGELIHGLAPGEEIVITENNLPVATLVGPPRVNQQDFTGIIKKPRELGTMSGTVLSMEHFDDPLFS